MAGWETHQWGNNPIDDCRVALTERAGCDDDEEITMAQFKELEEYVFHAMRQLRSIAERNSQ